MFADDRIKGELLFVSFSANEKRFTWRRRDFSDLSAPDDSPPGHD
jgi:hypothetical protein